MVRSYELLRHLFTGHKLVTMMAVTVIFVFAQHGILDKLSVRKLNLVQRLLYSVNFYRPFKDLRFKYAARLEHRAEHGFLDGRQ